jgi:hypothetical protein
MFVELNRDELSTLVRLVEAHIHQERGMTCEEPGNGSKSHASPTVEREVECLCRILHKLHECECDVFA